MNLTINSLNLIRSPLIYLHSIFFFFFFKEKIHLKCYLYNRIFFNYRSSLIKIVNYFAPIFADVIWNICSIYWCLEILRIDKIKCLFNELKGQLYIWRNYWHRNLHQIYLIFYSNDYILIEIKMNLLVTIIIIRLHYILSRFHLIIYEILCCV